MKTFPLDIVTPTRLIEEGDVTYVRCPGIDGAFGIMANHREGIIALGFAERSTEIDSSRAEEALERAKARFKEPDESSPSH